MGPISALAAVAGIYTSMLWLTARRLKQVTEAFVRREAEIDAREQELLKNMHQYARPNEF